MVHCILSKNAIESLCGKSFMSSDDKILLPESYAHPPQGYTTASPKTKWGSMVYGKIFLEFLHILRFVLKLLHLEKK